MTINTEVFRDTISRQAKVYTLLPLLGVVAFIVIAFLIGVIRTIYSDEHFYSLLTGAVGGFLSLVFIWGTKAAKHLGDGIGSLQARVRTSQRRVYDDFMMLFSVIIVQSVVLIPDAFDGLVNILRNIAAAFQVDHKVAIFLVMIALVALGHLLISHHHHNGNN